MKLTVGDEVGAQKVATLVDDTQMRLTQYYSYAYQSELYAGQTVQVSVPTLMSSIDGRVEKVHMVKRVTSEGSELFSVEIVVPNAGVLAKDMAASATVVVNGETVYPYESGKLDYYRTSELSIPRTPRTPSLIWSRACKRHRRSWRRRKKMPPTQTPLRPLTAWSSA